VEEKLRLMKIRTLHHNKGKRERKVASEEKKKRAESNP